MEGARLAAKGWGVEKRRPVAGAGSGAWQAPGQLALGAWSRGNVYNERVDTLARGAVPPRSPVTRR